MILTLFNLPDTHPIAGGNSLTKDLRMAQANQLGFLGEAESFHVMSHNESPFGNDLDDLSGANNYLSIIVNPETFKKSPGK